ncbi:MAG: hypothetical protein JSS72_07210 [Armatimonadetes bacterium]|nr:hypothetical protein [Armatimonadota bacterium]
MPPNSFLRRPVHSVRQLVAQVDNDSEVRDRYLRHFGMTRRELRIYLNELRPKVIQKDVETLVYNVPSSGLIRVRRLTIHKGETVYVDRDGNQVLWGKCGNPLTLGPKKVISVPIDERLAGNEHDLKFPDSENFAAENTPDDQKAGEPILAQQIPVEVPTEIPPEEAPQIFSPPFQPRIPIGLIFLPIIGIIPPGGGSGGPPPPVPEPASFLILAGAGAYLVARKRS